MKKYFYVNLILSVLFLQGCNKNDDIIVGKGEIHYDGHIYQLNNVTKTTTKINSTAIINDYMYHGYSHVLHFSSTDNKNDVKIRIGQTQKIPIDNENAQMGSETIELLSGDCFMSSVDISTFGNVIQSNIYLWLADEYDNITPQMNLVYEKKGDIFEIELKYIKGNSFVNWEGSLKEIE